MLVLMVSTAPKTWFHDAVAHHKDTVAVCNHPLNGSPCLHQSTIDCHFDLLVVTSLYVFKADLFPAGPALSFASFLCAAVAAKTSMRTGSPESRGPPAFC